MSEHTPGPWKAHGAHLINDDLLVTGPDNKTLAAISFRPGSGCGGVATAKANARLIAAAPDLLEALGNIVSDNFENTQRGYAIFRATQEVAEKARAAIDKAVTKPEGRC